MSKCFIDKRLTGGRFAKLYWSFLWRSTILSILVGVVVAAAIESGSIPADILVDPSGVLLIVLLSLGLDWFVRYQVLSKIVWSDFRVGFLKNKGEPVPITPWVALSMTILSAVVTTLFTVLFVVLVNMLLANMDDGAIEALVPWLNGMKAVLGIWVEYLVLGWYMRYNLWVGGIVILYETTKQTRK